MDRIGETGWKVEYRIDNRALETVIRRMNSMVAVTIGPVSYTHLDVYKRQGKLCGNIGFNQTRIYVSWNLIRRRR